MILYIGRLIELWTETGLRLQVARRWNGIFLCNSFQGLLNVVLLWQIWHGKDGVPCFPLEIIMYMSHILLTNRSKSCKGCRLICVCFVTGVGMNLSSSAPTLIWSFVSSLFERFFMFFFVSPLLWYLHVFASLTLLSSIFATSFALPNFLRLLLFLSLPQQAPGLILYRHQVLSIDPAGPCVPPLILFLLILQSS